MMLRTLDLFSGIGGFSLGLERTGGFKTVAFCEIDPFCRRVLAKHWPKVPIYEDVRELTGARLAADGIAVDVICGGFPCQDISRAGAPHGRRQGVSGSRSGLWFEFARITGEIRPRFVIVENGSDLLSLGIADVLGSLSSIGFDAEWHCIPASAIGAPQRRDRMWIVAYSNGERLARQHGQRQSKGHTGRSCASGARPILSRVEAEDWLPEPRMGRVAARLSPKLDGGGLNERDEALGVWEREPDEPRVAHGVKNRAARLRALGNAVVPQIPELIGNAILAANGARE
jgi:DNA (cytosine-5)-methyltransferase 1